MNDSQNISHILFNDGMPREPGKRVRAVRSLYPLSRLQYEEFRSTPIPSTPEHVLRSVGTNFAKVPGEANLQPDAKPVASKEHTAFQNRLAEMFERLSGLEAFEMTP